MNKFIKYLTGGDLRSIGESNKIVNLIRTQKDFDELFLFLFDSDRKIVMRAADAIEKITADNYKFLSKHKLSLIELCSLASDKELKWHLALLVSRLKLSNDDFLKVWNKLSAWAQDKEESRIVRVNSVQGLFNILPQNIEREEEFDGILFTIEKQNIPSINARIRNLRKKLHRQSVSN